MASDRELYEFANYTFGDLVDEIVNLRNEIQDLNNEIEKLQEDNNEFSNR